MTFSSGWCGPLQSSEFPNWLGAVGTTAAALIAALGFLLVVLDRQKRQARLVSCTLTKVYLRPKGYEYEHEGELTVSDDSGRTMHPRSRTIHRVRLDAPATEVRMTFTNRSDEQISRVTCDLLGPDGATLRTSIWALLVVSPAHNEDFALHLQKPEHLNIPRVGCQTRMRFTDASGVRWERVSGKPLRRRWRDYECDPTLDTEPFKGTLLSDPLEGM